MKRSNPNQEINLPLSETVEKPNFASGSLLFVGTATVVLRYAGFTILTDPNFLHQGDHIHLGYGIRSTRLTNPGLEIEELPPLDFIILSHFHEDHFDRVAVDKLNKSLPIITTDHAAKNLKNKGFTRVYPLKSWESFTIKKGEALVQITAMPARHGPGIFQALLPPVIGSILEFFRENKNQSSTLTLSEQMEEESQTTAPIFRLYITGDTIIYEELKKIPQHYKNIDLALLHLGGTKVLGILLTMDARLGVEAIQIIEPRLSIPIHFNDYTIFKSSLEEFIEAVKQAGLEERVMYLKHGDTYQWIIDN
ncbi:conserved hypothetical protein (plasmid) [Gloeothece citriformis PCC 7424]|uniref:Metallo-beta-lactamase domain-containing protein n=1 Tax=Gloeothece citriformis (strain PCC 7424) TaxID=65393 RepID=B7KLV8_GLOC7|nr:MBL fold metallo-hydrolase [Gloeothece citriformis]ACK73780.1 conserved hypothetical protein [Gloeothece citriformis PCC 7424]